MSKTEHFLIAYYSTIKFSNLPCLSASLLLTKGCFSAAQGLPFQPTRHLWPLCLATASYGGKPASTNFRAVHQNGYDYVRVTSHENALYINLPISP